MTEVPAIPSSVFWLSGVVMALMDAVVIFIFTRLIPPRRFRELRGWLAGAAAVSWSLFSLLLVQAFWETYYRDFYPAWFRPGGILVFVPLLYGAFAFAFHWLALHLPGNPLLNFFLLAGVESLLEHLYGIFGLKIMEIPILQQASPLSVLVFSFPEYIFYWCVVVALAGLGRALTRRIFRRKSARADLSG